MGGVTEDGLVEVRMLGMPLGVRERSRQEGADLLREMALLQAGSGDRDDAHAVPARLLELARELDVTYGPYVSANLQEMDAALDRGEDSLDVVYRLPPSSVQFLEHLRGLLAEVEEYCRSDDYLLTLAPSGEVAAYREWSLEEVLRQLAGGPPLPWPAFAAAHGVA